MHLLIVTLIIIVVLVWRYIYMVDNFTSMKTITDIDAVIYINLENREDRKPLIKGEITALGIPEDRIHKVSGVHIPNNGHKGCIQAHILALQMVKMNNWRNVLILEDDAEIVDRGAIGPAITAMFNYLRDRNITYDVILLATANSNKAPIDGDTSKLLARVSGATTASAYIINGGYTDKMMFLFQYLNLMMSKDKWTEKGHEKYALDQNWQNMQAQDAWYGWTVDLMRQRNISSTTNQKM